MQRDIRALVDGARGGALGTAAMSAVMAVGARLGLLGTAPPEKIAAKTLAALGFRHRKEGAQDALTVVGHDGFGIGIGALFALLHRRLRPPIPPAMHGVIFATIIWAVSYKGWVPALGLMRPPRTPGDDAGCPRGLRLDAGRDCRAVPMVPTPVARRRAWIGRGSCMARATMAAGWPSAPAGGRGGLRMGRRRFVGAGDARRA